MVNNYIDMSSENEKWEIEGIQLLELYLVPSYKNLENKFKEKKEHGENDLMININMINQLILFFYNKDKPYLEKYYDHLKNTMKAFINLVETFKKEKQNLKYKNLIVILEDQFHLASVVLEDQIKYFS